MTEATKITSEPAGGFTPGPWHTKPGDTPGFRTNSGGAGIYAAARSTDDFFILKIAEMATNVPRDAEANARLIAEAPALVEDGWTLALFALQSDRYGKDMDFRDAVDAMLDTCRRAKGEKTFAETQAAKATGAAT